ncbi:DNA-binding protein [Nocardioides sp.]|uniref:helix-turn-helix transcriptional regulator n=1 Tax=Nocardioides sp. TaxID=35761 RepID=UPI002C4E52AC|nr:DNA-binding protein [Nocardioides sp.]HSX69046.1 DNA-binding protein [Nocardioides sp.]
MEQGTNVEALPRMLTTTQVSKRLCVSASTLCRWRMAGIGPRVYWLGPTTPRYSEADVLDWLEGVAA